MTTITALTALLALVTVGALVALDVIATAELSPSPRNTQDHGYRSDRTRSALSAVTDSQQRTIALPRARNSPTSPSKQVKPMPSPASRSTAKTGQGPKRPPTSFFRSK